MINWFTFSVMFFSAISLLRIMCCCIIRYKPVIFRLLFRDFFLHTLAIIIIILNSLYYIRWRFWCEQIDCHVDLNGRFFVCCCWLLSIASTRTGSFIRSLTIFCNLVLFVKVSIGFWSADSQMYKYLKIYYTQKNK